MKVKSEYLSWLIYNIGMKYQLGSISSWLNFTGLIEDCGLWAGYSQSQLLRAMKKGVNSGLFSRPYWQGVGLTPFAGSARRARYWEILEIPKWKMKYYENKYGSVVSSCS